MKAIPENMEQQLLFYIPYACYSGWFLCGYFIYGISFKNIVAKRNWNKFQLEFEPLRICKKKCRCAKMQCNQYTTKYVSFIFRWLAVADQWYFTKPSSCFKQFKTASKSTVILSVLILKGLNIIFCLLLLQFKFLGFRKQQRINRTRARAHTRTHTRHAIVFLMLSSWATFTMSHCHVTVIYVIFANNCPAVWQKCLIENHEFV